MPVETMRPAARGFATHQPAPDGAAILQSLAWSAGLLVVFSLLAVRLYHRAR